MDSPYSHRAWAKDLNIQYPLISDFARDFAAKYCVPLITGGALPGIMSRSAFVVDSEKIIRYIWYAPEGKGLPPVEDILNTTRTLSPPLDGPE